MRVWGTHPPERIQGFVLSPYFHLLRATPRARRTPSSRGTCSPRSPRARSGPATSIRRCSPTSRTPPPGREAADDPLLQALARDALAPDLTYARAAKVLRTAYAPSFFVLSFHGLDVVGHAFHRYAHPEAFGDVAAEDARRYGRVLDRYASLVERWVGELEQDLGPGTCSSSSPATGWRRCRSGAGSWAR